MSLSLPLLFSHSHSQSQHLTSHMLLLHTWCGQWNLVFFFSFIVIISLVSFGLYKVIIRIYVLFNFYFCVFCYSFSYLYWHENNDDMIIITITVCEKIRVNLTRLQPLFFFFFGLNLIRLPRCIFVSLV